MFSISQQRHSKYWPILGTTLGPWINETPSPLQEDHSLMGGRNNLHTTQEIMIVCYDKIKYSGGAASKLWGCESQEFQVTREHTSQTET